MIKEILQSIEEKLDRNGNIYLDYGKKTEFGDWQLSYFFKTWSLDYEANDDDMYIEYKYEDSVYELKEGNERIVFSAKSEKEFINKFNKYRPDLKELLSIKALKALKETTIRHEKKKH